MKTASLLILLVSLGTSPLALAQGESMGTIKATTKLRPDGTTSNTVVDPEQRTAVETISVRDRITQKEKVLQKKTFLLDEKNLALGAIHYDAKGAVRYKESYVRDMIGHVVETKFTSADDQPLGRRVFTFNGDKVSNVEDYDARGVLIPARKPTNAARPDKKKK